MSDAVERAGVSLSHPDKVLYPDQGITKIELADYYLAVAPAMLPHVADRPITLMRCPAGRAKTCFYQRHAGSGVPPELRAVPIFGFESPYLFIAGAPGLVALVQMGVLEIHPWGAKAEHPDRPDRVVIDLDPGEGLGFVEVVAAARELRVALAALQLDSFVKTTGGKGLHVVFPIEPEHDWASVKRFAKGLADRMATAAPTRFLARSSIAARRGRIYVDYLRNDPTATAVAPYSTRARDGATVATPLDWEELDPALDPRAFTVETVPARLARLGRDPWAGMAAVRQRLPV